MTAFNILFTSAGRRVSLARLFREALSSLDISGSLVAADLRKDAPATFVADVREQVPRVDAPDYIPCLLELCRRHDIRLLVPLIDTELSLLSLHREAFAELGVTVLVSSPAVNGLCFDKRKTAEFFKQAGVATPAILEAEAILKDPSACYPFLVKPACGSCSVGVTRVNNARELAFFVDYVDDAMVQEFMQGDEYTVDVLVDFAGRVRSVVPRLRIETRAGEVSKGVTVKDERIIAEACRVAESLPGAAGCLTLQCFLTPGGEIRFIEINPRFGGGYPLSAAAGADFPRWIIEMLLGRHEGGRIDDWDDGVAMLRYDEGLFLGRGELS